MAVTMVLQSYEQLRKVLVSLTHWNIYFLACHLPYVLLSSASRYMGWYRCNIAHCHCVVWTSFACAPLVGTLMYLISTNADVCLFRFGSPL